MFSGNGYTQKPLSWEKRKVWGNKKKKRKGCPAEGFWRIRGSQKHRQSALRQATRHVDFLDAVFPAGRQRIPKRKQITITRKSY